MNQSHLEVVRYVSPAQAREKAWAGHIAFRPYFLLAEKEAREFLPNHKAMLPRG